MESLYQYAAPRAPNRQSDSVEDTERFQSLFVRDGLRYAETEELVHAIQMLALGRRGRVAIPVISSPHEITILRDGDDALVSYYDVSANPEAYLYNYRIGLSEFSRLLAEKINGEDMGALRSELESLEMCETAWTLQTVTKKGGVSASTEASGPLGFGFTLDLTLAPVSPSECAERSDVWSLLAPGHLYAYVRGKKIHVGYGPIILFAQRMLDATRACVSAWEDGRPSSVRLRCQEFVIGMRMERGGEINFSLGRERGGTITVPALSLTQAIMPPLRFASDLLRAMASADRSYSRNLRLTRIRDDVRSIRKRVRTDIRVDSLINHEVHPERWTRPIERSALIDSESQPENKGLRMNERWSLSFDGLDANSTFLCGDRLVIATPSSVAAVNRDDGQVLWEHPRPNYASFMAGQTLVCMDPTGHLELCDARTGVFYASTFIPNLNISGAVTTHISSGGVPPTSIFTDTLGRMLAVDLRTGEVRWRFTSPAAQRDMNGVRFKRAGRLLLAAFGDASIHGIDAVTGELVWRYIGDRPTNVEPAFVSDSVVAVFGDKRRDAGEVTPFAVLDLVTGQRRFEGVLPGTTIMPPIACDRGAVCITQVEGQAMLSFVDQERGTVRWTVPDCGISLGGAFLAFDSSLVVNAPSGQVFAINVDNGETSWSRTLTNPTDNEVPRRLEPVLRAGALFVPSSSVHVLRPHDGSVIGGAIDCDLIPDCIRVDERGWVYVAEESGTLRSYAPTPVLRLIK